MSYQCFIIDDDMASIEVLTSHITKVPDMELLGYETDAQTGVDKILNGEILADIVFLDVEMPGINGIEIAKLIIGLSDVIFVTGHDQYARNAYDFDLIDHLSKPVFFPRFYKTAQKIRSYKMLQEIMEYPSSPGKIPIKKDRKGQYDFVSTASIFYIEAAGNYSKFIMSEEKNLITHQSLSAMEMRLNKKQFMRVHKKTIVNLEHIKRLSGARIEMSNGDLIQVGGTYLDAFLMRIKP